MSLPWAILVGVLLGAVGGGAHLAVTRWRAHVALTRGSALALLTFPLGLVGPALAVVGAAQLAPAAAWSTPIGIVLVRLVVLRRSGTLRRAGS